MIRHGYCPWCNAELSPVEIGCDKTITWSVCPKSGCKGSVSSNRITTDSQGYILEPQIVATRYIYGKNNTSYRKAQVA